MAGHRREQMLKNGTGVGERAGVPAERKGRSGLYFGEEDVFTQQISHHYTSVFLSGEGGTD